MRATLVLLSASAASALVGTPVVHGSRSDSLQMSASASRRAVLGAAVVAVLPFTALAADTALDKLVSDQDTLDREVKDIKDIDKKINAERAESFKDDVALSKANDAYLEALKKGDKKTAKELQAKIKALEVKEAAEDADVRALTAKETAAVAAEKAQAKKVKEDEAAEAKVETKEIIEAEEAELKKEVGGDTASFVSKFFK